MTRQSFFPQLVIGLSVIKKPRTMENIATTFFKHIHNKIDSIIHTVHLLDSHNQDEKGKDRITDKIFRKLCSQPQEYSLTFEHHLSTFDGALETFFFLVNNA